VNGLNLIYLKKISASYDFHDEYTIFFMKCYVTNIKFLIGKILAVIYFLVQRTRIDGTSCRDNLKQKGVKEP